MAAREEIRRQVTIVGRVTVAETGQPCAGAVVVVTGGPPAYATAIAARAAAYGNSPRAGFVSARTAVDGHFHFLDLPDGTYTLSATVPGAAGRSAEVTAEATVVRGPDGAVALEPVELELPVTVLRGRVIEVDVLYGARVGKEAGLIARWRLGETAVDAVDDVGGRRAVPIGTIVRAAPGLVVLDGDRAATLGGDGYFQAAFDAALNPAQFSLEAWVLPTGGAGTYRAVAGSRDNTAGDYYRGYTLYASNQDRWEFRLGDGTHWVTAVGGAVALGQTAHVVGTYDGSAARVYVNGALAGTSTEFVQAPNVARPFRIGAGWTEGTPRYFFTGTVDEVALYGAALPAEKLVDHFTLGSTPPVRGVAMAAVRVQGSGEQAFTNGDGRFSLVALEPGTSTVVVSAPGFDRTVRAVPLQVGQAADLTVELVRSPA